MQLEWELEMQDEIEMNARCEGDECKRCVTKPMKANQNEI